jgi:general secretion pathway protein A
MYQSFYNLATMPFHITPDPKFLYLSPSHREALAAIVYGIEQKKGFIAVVGAVGVGKTTILRSYLQTAEKKRLKIAYIFNARLTFSDLLKTVYRELGLAITSQDTSEMADRLYEFLIDEYQQGNTVVLVIDEAQNMPVDTLESLRMLSNFETPTDKLIQIVLVGQTEFADMLNSDRLRPLNQRLAIRSTILPLTGKESLEYIRFRLSKAGAPPDSVFAASSLKAIAATANGIPRVINVLCDNALITGFGYRQKPVTKKITDEIIRDFKGESPRRSSLRWASGAFALALFLVGIMSLLPFGEGVFERITARTHSEQSVPVVASTQEDRSGKPSSIAEQPQQSVPTAQASAPQVDKPTVAKRIVARGDSLSRLAQEVYGRSNAEVVNLIRKENPQITNPNLIMVGTTVAFPKVGGAGKEIN